MRFKSLVEAALERRAVEQADASWRIKETGSRRKNAEVSEREARAPLARPKTEGRADQVRRLVQDGLTDPEIAERLGVSRRWVAEIRRWNSIKREEP